MHNCYVFKALYTGMLQHVWHEISAGLSPFVENFAHPCCV